MAMAASYVLPTGCRPVPPGDGLDARYWEGTRRHELWVQRCAGLRTWQWGPEMDLPQLPPLRTGWEQVAPTGVIYSWERLWHPVHRALSDSAPTSCCWSSCPTPATSAWSATSPATRWQPFAIGDRVRSRLRGPRRRRGALHARPLATAG